MTIRIFSHRGYKKENKIEGLKNSFANGYKAIEFDIWYLNDIFLLNHDQPIQPYKNYDKLEDFLAIFKNQLDYWLDFKNLDEENSTTIISRLKLIIDKIGIDYSKLYFAPFITDIKLGKTVYETIKKYFGNQAKILAVCEKINKEKQQHYYQSLKENDIYKLSINYQNIDQEFVRIFSDIEIFAWTVNNLKDAKYLRDIGVKNMTSDNIIPNQLL